MMAGNEDKPRLPQRRGRKAPGDLPDGFEPIVPLFRRRKAPAPTEPAPAAQSEAPPVPPRPPRPLPRSAAEPPRPATPAKAIPEPERPPVIAEPTPQGGTSARVLVAAIAALLVLLVVLAILLLG
jgi:hypothetical protein